MGQWPILNHAVCCHSDNKKALSGAFIYQRSGSDGNGSNNQNLLKRPNQAPPPCWRRIIRYSWPQAQRRKCTRFALRTYRRQQDWGHWLLSGCRVHGVAKVAIGAAHFSRSKCCTGTDGRGCFIEYSLRASDLVIGLAEKFDSALGTGE